MDKQITIRMPKDLLAKWLAALRSGEYKQCKDTLFDGAGYCCLGVLQAAVSGQVEYELDAPRGMPTFEWLAERDIEFRGGLASNRPPLPSLGVSADQANDRGKTFTEIADAIEACAEGV